MSIDITTLALAKEYTNRMVGSGGTGSGGGGGYYTPGVTQPTADTMQISFAPSKPDMPAVNTVTVNLPVSENSGHNQIQELATEGSRISMLAPISGAYYFVLDTSVLWTYRNGWIQITTSPLSIEQTITTIIQGKIDNGELGGMGAISAIDDGSGNVILTVVGFYVLDDNQGNITIS